MTQATAYAAWSSVNGAPSRTTSPGQFTGFNFVRRDGRAVPLFHISAQALDGGPDADYTFAVERATGALITLNGRAIVTA